MFDFPRAPFSDSPIVTKTQVLPAEMTLPVGTLKNTFQFLVISFHKIQLRYLLKPLMFASTPYRYGNTERQIWQNHTIINLMMSNNHIDSYMML